MLQWQSVLGRLNLKITCADSVGILNQLANAQIPLENVIHCNDLELQITVNRKDFSAVRYIAKKAGASVKILHQNGFILYAKALLRRPVMVVSMLIFLLMTVFLPTRILFVSVQGNEFVPTKQILEAADACGIGFGAVGRHVRSEVMKNALLEKIPQLQWAGINTQGCTAVISVREKTSPEVNLDTQNQVCSIVASRDGIIQDCTVYRGNPLCVAGQAVKAGQTLVSGYLDCGIVTKATRADAEIKALTFRQSTVVTPQSSLYRGDEISRTRRLSLRVGKKLIKFYKDSGNSYGVCGKIYTEEYIYLPGGFVLPISIIQETLITYEEATPASLEIEDCQWLADSARAYLISLMPGGQVLSEKIKLDAGDGVFYLYGQYACTELIGQIRYEQTIIKDELDD